MVLYLHLMGCGWRRWSTYRAATVAGAFTNTVFGFLLASVLLAVFRGRPEINGFDADQAVTFTFLAQGFLAPVSVFGWQEVARRIRTGDVASDLQRPADFQLWWLAQDLGRAGYQFVFRGLPPVVAGALAFGLEVSGSPVHWAAFVVAAVGAVVVSFGIRFLVNLVAFWLLDATGPVQVVDLTCMFLSGMFVPIVLFPGWLESVARASPFASVVAVPVEILLGRHRGAGLVAVLAVQAAWAVVLLVAGRLVLGQALRRLVVQGG